MNPEEYKQNPIYLDQVRGEALEYYENLRLKYGGNIENMLNAIRSNI